MGCGKVGMIEHFDLVAGQARERVVGLLWFGRGRSSVPAQVRRQHAIAQTGKIFGISAELQRRHGDAMTEDNRCAGRRAPVEIDKLDTVAADKTPLYQLVATSSINQSRKMSTFFGCRRAVVVTNQ